MTCYEVMNSVCILLHDSIFRNAGVLQKPETMKRPEPLKPNMSWLPSLFPTWLCCLSLISLPRSDSQDKQHGQVLEVLPLSP